MSHELALCYNLNVVLLSFCNFFSFAAFAVLSVAVSVVSFTSLAQKFKNDSKDISH